MDKLKDNIPILSAILIFTGYLNYQFFYSHFDIEIESYLTTTELIFSFLPLTIPFLLVLTFLLFWAIGLHLVIERQENEIDKRETLLEIISSTSTAWTDLVEYFKRPKKNISFWTGLPFSLLIFIMSIAVKVFMVAYVYIFIINVFKTKPYDYLDFGFWPTLILGIIWIVFLFIKVDKYQEEKTKARVRILNNILVITVAVGLLRLSNKENAEKILNGKPQFNAKVQFAERNIQTDSVLVYVGQTSSFMFLRDLRTNENIVLKMDQIKSFNLFKTDREQDKAKTDKKEIHQKK